MSKLDGYKPFTIVKNAIAKLETQKFINLAEQKELIAELITQDLIEAGVLREFIISNRPIHTNRHTFLKQFVTEGGRITYIREMEFDADTSIFKLKLQFNPEADFSNKTLIFRNVRAFEEILDNNEDELSNYLEQIIGLDEYSTKYVLRTEVREIVFFSEAIPEIC